MTPVREIASLLFRERRPVTIGSIAAFLAGDIEAARRVELDLPQTGVCSANRDVLEPASSCCTPTPETADNRSCCEGSRVLELADLPAE